MIDIETLKLTLHKKSLSWIEREVERLEEQGLDASEQYKIIDAELDHRLAIKCQAETAAKLKADQERQELENELKKLNEINDEKVVMRAMVLEFGSDFIDDYHIDDVFTVHSIVKNCENWECESPEDANKKIEQLVYWRVYDNYFRDGPTREDLSRLQERIITIKKGQNQ